MTSNQSALVAIVQASREDEALMSALVAAARHLLGDAEARADALRADARRLRQEARQNLNNAQCHFEAAGQRLRTIGALQLEAGVKDAALRAARVDLSARRISLRKAAEGLEAAVARAQALEARADEVMSAVQRQPEVTAWQPIRGTSGNGRPAPHPGRRGSGLSMTSEVAEAHDG